MRKETPSSKPMTSSACLKPVCQNLKPLETLQESQGRACTQMLLLEKVAGKGSHAVTERHEK